MWTFLSYNLGRLRHTIKLCGGVKYTYLSHKRYGLRHTLRLVNMSAKYCVKR